MKLTLRDLATAGVRNVSRYTGTVFAVFVVQSLAALGTMLAFWIILAQAFAHLPRFDDAVDGDPVAIFECVRYADSSWLAIAAIVIGAVVAWELASWFLVGGIIGVITQRPEGRRDTARAFGASGATTYLAYARLALCSLPGWILALFIALTGLHAAVPKLQHALTMGDLLAPIALAIIPAALVLHVLFTITDYARVELTVRHDSHDPGVVATYLRSIVYVVRRPLTLVHASLGWVLFWVVTFAYAYLSAGHPMFGRGGAIMLFALRQGVALVRLILRFAVIAGQVTLGHTRSLPPRRSDPKLEKERARSTQ